MEYCKVRPDEVDSLTFVVYSTVDTNQSFSFTSSHSDEYVGGGGGGLATHESTPLTRAPLLC